jgi:anti-sigma factor RsiW
MMRDCPDGTIRDLLPDFVHETLSAAEHARMERHLAACVDCTAEVELIRSARAALAALTPAVDVSRIVASLPATPTASLQRSARLPGWRMAAAVGLVALGGLSVVLLRGIFVRAPGGATVTAAGVVATPGAVPDSGPVMRQPPAAARGREVAVTRHEEGVSFGGGMSDLTDDQLKTLLREIDALPATPNTEPEVHTTAIAPFYDGENHAR